MENCVYKFLNKNKEVIYVGRAKNLKARLSGHRHLDINCYKSIEYVQYITVKDVNLLDFIECYFIQKYKPKYNSIFNKGSKVFSIDELDRRKWRFYKEYKKHIHISNLEHIKKEEALERKKFLEKIGIFETELNVLK